MLYADDILLIAPSVNELQILFRNCEKELEWSDMRINAKKNHVNHGNVANVCNILSCVKNFNGVNFFNHD